MRRVVGSHEVPHLWIHQAQDSARNSNGSFYFSGDTIYSYRNSWPIAKIIGPRDVLINDRKYSVTTSRHTTLAIRAIPPRYNVWSVCDPSWSIERNLEHLKAQEIEPLMAEVARAGRRATRKFQNLAALIERYNYIAEHFAIEGRVEMPATLDEIRVAVAKREQEQEEAFRQSQAIADAIKAMKGDE